MILLLSDSFSCSVRHYVDYPPILDYSSYTITCKVLYTILHHMYLILPSELSILFQLFKSFNDVNDQNNVVINLCTIATL